jgi:hypothetical protein
MTIPSHISVFMFRGAADLKIHKNLETYLSPPEYFLIYNTYMRKKKNLK